MAKTKGSDAVVKVDSGLLKEVEEFINKKENKLKYTNKKQFVDLAIYEKLRREEDKKGAKR
ncbi:MAG: hypothetical protein WCP89_01435 [archaeon]